MEKVGNMKFYTFDEVLDEQIGVVGTPQRDNFEKQAQIMIDEYYLGESIRRAREERNITASQLAERAGVRCSQLTRLEKGNGGSISLLTKICNALGVRLQMTM